MGQRPIALASLGDSVQVIEASVKPDADTTKFIIDVSEGYGRKKLLRSIPVSFLKTPGDRQRFLLAYEGEPSVIVVDIDPKQPPMKQVARAPSPS